MMIGAVGDAGSPNGASFSDLEVVAAAFFDRALTTDEITTIVEGYGTV
jgi:hypothetical protein